MPACIVDHLVGGDRPSAPPSSEERYLVYAPQFGLSSQAVALRNALAWASVLNRTLVLPHLLGRESAQERAAYGQAYDLSVGRAGIAPVQVVEMDQFAALGLVPERLLQLDTRTEFASAAEDYLGAVLGLPSASVLPVPLATFTTAALRGAFGGCGSHRVLAFQSLFGAFDHKPRTASPADWAVGGEEGLAWLDLKAMPALLSPSAALASSVSLVLRRVRPQPEARTLGCVHVRRGDFAAECARHLREAPTPAAPPWLLEGLRRGYSCWQSDDELALNVRRLRSAHAHGHERAVPAAAPPCTDFEAGVDFSGHDCRCMGRGGKELEQSGVASAAHCAALCGPLLAARPLSPPVEGNGYFTFRPFDGACWCKTHSTGRASKVGFTSGRACRLPPPPPPPPPPPSPPPLPPLVVFGAADVAAADAAALRALNVSLQRDVAGVDEALAAAALPGELGRALVDQLVCARASWLLLNAFSAFSQLVQARIGARHAPLIGWVRELSAPQQEAAGVHVGLLYRVDPFDRSRLLV